MYIPSLLFGGVGWVVLSGGVGFLFGLPGVLAVFGFGVMFIAAMNVLLSEIAAAKLAARKAAVSALLVAEKRR